MKLDIATIKFWQKKQSVNLSYTQQEYLKNECMDKYFQQHLIAMGMICILRTPIMTNGELWKKSFEKTQDQVRDRRG